MSEEDEKERRFNEFGDMLCMRIANTLAEYMTGSRKPQFAIVVFEDDDVTDCCYFSGTPDRQKVIEALKAGIFLIEEPPNKTKH